MWRAVFLCLALLIVGFDAASSNSQNWSGVWKDKCTNENCYGGELVLCVDGDKISGRYSNIGVLRGTIKGKTVTGYWYEAGYSQYSSGEFEWTLLDHGEFSGSWWYTFEKCERYGWSSQRVAEEIAQPIDCGVLPKSAGDTGLDGFWTSNRGSELSLCRDDYQFIHGSAKLMQSDDSIVDVTLAGQSWEEGRIITGSYWSPEVESNGIFLIVLSNNAEGLAIAMNWWPIEAHELAVSQQSSMDSTDVFIQQDVGCPENIPSNGLTWEGAFRDHVRGFGSIFFCVNGDKVQGTFSELGWIEGEIQGDRMTGRFYTAGFRENIDSGFFEITLINNGHTFQGYYEINGKPKPWFSQRTDANSYYASNCWATPETGSIVGRWYYGKGAGDFFDVCLLDDDSIEISYTYDGVNEGYARGFPSSSGSQSVQATFWEQRTHGVAMYRLVDDTHMIESFWAEVEFAEQVKFDICDGNVVNFDYWGHHSVNRLKRMSPFQDRELCARNKRLYDLKTIYSQSSSSGESSASTITVLSISFFALLLLSL